MAEPFKTIRLVRRDKEPNRDEIYTARIQQSWREWHGINGEPWQAYKDSLEPTSGKVSEALDKATYRVNVSERPSLFRRILRFLFRIT